MANYMADVAKLLGVEIDEHFKISENSKTCEGIIYKLTTEGLYGIFENNKNPSWFNADGSGAWDGILTGKYEIVKLPWKPKYDDAYFYPNITSGCVCTFDWEGDTTDYALKALKMCYRTREEAEANFEEDYKKLTGKEW